jgi:hypothetical protein
VIAALAPITSTAAGGIAMGRIAERIGLRWTLMLGALSSAAALAVSSGGSRAPRAHTFSTSLPKLPPV